MKIVGVEIDGYNDVFKYREEIAKIKKITTKTITIDGSFYYGSKYDKGNLDKIIFNNGRGVNSHSTILLRLKIVSLCEDDEVENTIIRLKTLLYNSSIEEINRRKEELEKLETAVLALK